MHACYRPVADMVLRREQPGTRIRFAALAMSAMAV